MCRWLAYIGPPIYLDTLIFEPENSLVCQSLSALESELPTSGDGVGVGWYGSKPEPGLYRDTLPAWNDPNLRSVSEQVRSRLFFAHVRGSTGAPTARANCHPFRHGRRLFMHNGKIGGFERIRRDLTLRISPELFPHLQGTTDSEVFFYLLLGNGLAEDPAAALARTVGEVMAAMADEGIEEPLRLTAAVTDGDSVIALRFASDGEAPTLYFAKGAAGRSPDSIVILSEPLDRCRDNWIGVPQGHLLRAAGGLVALAPFAPSPAAGRRGLGEDRATA